MPLNERQAALRLVRQVRQQVEDLLEQGETAWFRPPAKLPNDPRQREWAVLAKAVAACEACGLARERHQAVFGEGSPAPQLVFVGEAPGADEDREGRPFVGAAGKLLTKIIESIGLKREDVYILNVLKCRPPGNRNPLPEEIAACRPYLEQQLAWLKPKLICALGTFSAQTLLGSTLPIGQLRGKLHDYQGIPVVPTLHPAALLYHPQNKRLVWEDMKRIAQLLQASKA